MAHYIDGFVLPIAKDKIDRYRQIAEEAGKIWREHGALEYRECVGDDLDVKDQVPFPRIIETKPDETVVLHGSSSSRANIGTGQRPGDRRLAPGRDGRRWPDALRLQAHGLRRLQDHRRSLIARNREVNTSN
jgi:hypothetical protein